MLSATVCDRKRLVLLIGLAAALVLVYVAVHGVPGRSASAEADEADYVAPASTAAEAADSPASGGSGAARRAETACRRRVVVRIAREKNPENLPTLKKAAADPAWQVRHAAVDGVGRLGREGDPAFLIEVLRNPAEQAEVRAAAADRLGEMRCWDAGPAIIDAMEDSAEPLRARAAAALRRIIVPDLGFRADDPPGKRAEVIARIRELWPWFYEKYSGQAIAGGPGS